MSLVKYNNNSISAVTSASLIPLGALTHIKTLTASSSSTLSFVHGSNGVVLDNTYPIYKFEFINIHPATDSVNFTFNLSTDGGSNYNVTKTSSVIFTAHNEGDSATYLDYDTNQDLAQSTGEQEISDNTGNDADQNLCGTLELFSPSSTTFVKNFICKVNNMQYHDYMRCDFTAGYGNTQSAVNAIRFKFSSGDISSGKIKLYGIKDS